LSTEYIPQNMPSATVVPAFFSYFGYMIKDVGQRIALMGHFTHTHRYAYPITRHQNVRVYRNLCPWTQDAGFIAPSAHVIGNVVLGHDTVVYYHSTIRNFHSRNATIVGDHSVILDRVSFLGQVRVGHHTVVGIGSTLDCCEIHDNVYIGAGSSVCLGAVVESGAIIAPGSVVPKDTRIPAGELWAGVPAEKISDVTPEQAKELKHMVHHHVENAKHHGHAIHDHVHATENLNSEWLANAMQLMEAQQQQVRTKAPVEIPIEAKRFLEPRVHMRRPEMHLRSSYPVNKIAPWMPKAPDQAGNC